MNKRGRADSSNRSAVLRVVLFICLAGMLAATAPAEMWLGVTASLLWMGALFSAVSAVFVRDPFWGASTLTRWDEALILTLISMTLGYLAPASPP